ncbi:MAG: peptidyl-prolyl cis-trans isomerase [bacterium]|nr:peptidyl-prolyl cis-trans isomerase [bacterium]
MAFEQIYLGENPDPESVASLLSTLQSDPAVDPSSLGERTLLPSRLDPSPPSAVDGVFGSGFFDLVVELPTGNWSGPVASSYGSHLVHIRESEPSQMPPLDDVREAVLRDWTDAKSKEIGELYYGQLRERYTVDIQRGDTPADDNP